LTARQVATLGAGLHADGGSLYLRVEPSGARRWAFIFRWHGKRTEMGLGSALAVTLARAREIAQTARADVEAGTNPVEKRRRDRAHVAGRSFGQAAEDLMAALAAGFKSDVHKAQWRTTLMVDAARLAPKDVSAITTEDVLSVLKPIWLEKPETAARLRGRIERVLDAERVLGHRAGDNPARWRGHLAHILSKRQKLTRGHHRAMPIDAMPDFMAELRARFEGMQRTASIARNALEYLILTLARTGEVIGVHTSEVNLADGIWTVPAARMKMKTDHRVALSRRAIAIVEACWPAQEGFLFPGLKPGQHLSNMAMLALLQKDLGYPNLTVHGFRSTFKDWATERTHYPDVLSEIALAHKVGDETKQAYMRSDALDKRRRMMESWSMFCAGGDAKKVIPFSA
jgi:integrase